MIPVNTERFCKPEFQIPVRDAPERRDMRKNLSAIIHKRNELVPYGNVHLGLLCLHSGKRQYTERVPFPKYQRPEKEHRSYITLLELDRKNTSRTEQNLHIH